MENNSVSVVKQMVRTVIVSAIVFYVCFQLFINNGCSMGYNPSIDYIQAT